MGSRTVKFSDLSDTVVEDPTKLGRLVIEEHPTLRLPITLEVLPEEIEGSLTSASRYVVLAYYKPGERDPERAVLSLDDFNKLAGDRGMEELLTRVMLEQHQRRGMGDDTGQPRRRGRPRKDDPIGARTTERIDYSDPENAGLPHRGKVAEAE